VKLLLLSAMRYVAAIPYRGTGRYCPICEKTSKSFGPFGLDLREDAQCMHCGSLERHRLVWLYLQRKTHLFDSGPKTILHVAPEGAFVPRLRERFGGGYITADLHDAYTMVKMDVMDIQFSDNTFDFINCSHVLEHVPDDRLAMREFYRILKPDGFAILLVPIWREVTFEDPSVVEPEERLRVFGQSDHVRIYGRDYVHRLAEAGFVVEESVAADLLSEDEIELMALRNAGELFVCTKRTTGE
jgi:SAM-dependent methyltransferase